MKPNIVVVLTLLIVGGGLGVGVFVLPTLEANADKLARSPAVAESAERARRQLIQFDADLQRLAEMQSGAAETLGEDFDAAYRRELDALGAQLEKTARYMPAEQALGGVKTSIEQNDRVLDVALSEMKVALGASIGDAQGEGIAYVQRLNGMILYAKGLSDSWHALIMRGELCELEGRIRSGGQELVRLGLAVAPSPSTLFDSSIASTRTSIEGLQTQRKELTGQKEDCDAKAAKLAQQLEAAQSRAQQTRSLMEALERNGVDFSDPKGAEIFAGRYEPLAADYRNAMRDAQIAEFGTLPNAEPDPAGGVLEGEYIEKNASGSPTTWTLQYGLRYYQKEMGRINGAINEIESALKSMEEQLAQIESEKKLTEERQGELRQRREEELKRVEEWVSAWKSLREKILEAENKAVGRFDQSSRAFAAAAGLVDRTVAKAQERLRDIPSEIQPFSAYKAGSDMEWISSQLLAEASRSLAAKGAMLCQRSQHDRAALGLFESFSSASPALASAASELSNAVAETDLAFRETMTQAIEKLERAAAQGSLRNNWAYVAQMANLGSLLVLSGEVGLTSQVIQNYRAALQGREDQDALAPIKARMEFMSKG